MRVTIGYSDLTSKMGKLREATSPISFRIYGNHSLSCVSLLELLILVA